MSKRTTKGLYVDLPPDVKKGLDMQAAFEGRYKNELVAEAIAAYLENKGFMLDAPPRVGQLPLPEAC